MGTLYKVYEDFESVFTLANSTGIIALANNVIENNREEFANYDKITDFESAKNFLTEKCLLNVTKLDNSYMYIEDKTIIDIGDNYITLE